jgi:hypothetical protein
MIKIKDCPKIKMINKILKISYKKIKMNILKIKV